MLTVDLNEKIEMSGLSAADRLALRAAIGALEFLRAAAADCRCPVDDLDGARLIQWVASRGRCVAGGHPQAAGPY
jgi:hypothetical protein